METNIAVARVYIWKGIRCVRTSESGDYQQAVAWLDLLSRQLHNIFKVLLPVTLLFHNVSLILLDVFTV
jgi:hypothetical protein